MRSLTLLMGLLVAAPAWALEGPAPASDAPASTITAPAAATPDDFQPGTGKSVHLGKIEVQGVKPLVQTLQEIKLAVKRPFDNDPAHFDDMVCRLDVGRDSGYRAQGGALECGTQGWFRMQRDAYSYGGVMQTGIAAVSPWGHPWHVVRPLNMRQLQAMREVLKGLPPPGQGEVQVIDEEPEAAGPNH